MLNYLILYIIKIKKFKKLKIKHIYVIIIIFYLIYVSLYSNVILKLSTEKEIEHIEKYLVKCSGLEGKKFHYSHKNLSPKISIISPIYNRGKYLLRFLKSIYYQNFKDIEIILIDDCSSDDTINLIKLYKKFDKRIILIQNKKNFGTFKSRNIGILVSKGEYVILPDPDDILAKNSLNTLYSFAKKNDYDMVRFNLYFGNNHIFMSNTVKKIPSKPIFKPVIQTFLYYATGKLFYIDYNVTNKFIKRCSLIIALNILGKEYLNIYMKTFEDQLLLIYL